MKHERLPITRSLVSPVALVALLGAGVRGDHVHAQPAECEFTSSALADASELPDAFHQGLKQVVDIYNMVEPGPLKPQKNGDYHGSLHITLPKSTTEFVLDITATDKFATLDGGNPFPDNVTDITSTLINHQTGIPYARQRAEKDGTAWKITGDYLTNQDELNDSYQTTSVTTSGGLYACAVRTDYTVQNNGHHVVMNATQAEVCKSVDVARKASQNIVGQLVVMAGVHQHFNRGVLDYQFPTSDAAFLRKFNMAAPVSILQPPESKP